LSILLFSCMRGERGSKVQGDFRETAAGMLAAWDAGLAGLEEK